MGKSALVDADRYDVLITMGSWIFQTDRAGGYAAIRRKNEKIIYMHRIVLGLSDDQETDHRNGDKLDNRINNLRVATLEQNNGNRPKHVSDVRSISSKFKGVYRPTSGRMPWGSVITLNHKTVPLGRFETELEAALVYDDAAREAWGEFACTNFPRGKERPALIRVT